MASEGVVNRLMQSLNIFILLFEIFFLSLLRIAVILFLPVYYTASFFFFFLPSAPLRIVSFDDGHVLILYPSMYPMSFVRPRPHRLISLLNLMTRHDHGFSFLCYFSSPTLPHKREMCS